MNRKTQAGFSLVELVVAMTVTLIISGAAFKLMTAGQSAFRHEPARAERQQSIRVAMDTIAQDLYQAGSGLPAFSQVFTDQLNAQGPMGPGGADADELELFTSSECPALTVCEVSGTQLTTREMVSSCYNLPSLVILANDTEWHPYWAEAKGDASNASCSAGNNDGSTSGDPADAEGDDKDEKDKKASIDDAPGGPGATIVNVGRTHRGRSTVTRAVITGRGRTSRVVRTANGSRNGHLNFPPGHSSFNNSGGPNKVFDDPPLWVIVGQLIRYRINMDASGVPNLERSTFGGNNLPDGSSSWEVIAAGVEDLQVEYLNGTGWQDTPGTITCGSNCGTPSTAEYDAIIRRVRVTLSARALVDNLQGQSSSAVGDAVRGQLSTEVAPRPSVATLGMANGEF